MNAWAATLQRRKPNLKSVDSLAVGLDSGVRSSQASSQSEVQSSIQAFSQKSHTDTITIAAFSSAAEVPPKSNNVKVPFSFANVLHDTLYQPDSPKHTAQSATIRTCNPSIQGSPVTLSQSSLIRKPGPPRTEPFEIQHVRVPVALPRVQSIASVSLDMALSTPPAVVATPTLRPPAIALSMLATSSRKATPAGLRLKDVVPATTPKLLRTVDLPPPLPSGTQRNLVAKPIAVRMVYPVASTDSKLLATQPIESDSSSSEDIDEHNDDEETNDVVKAIRYLITLVNRMFVFD